MRILYIVPDVNNEGGVARVLSIKANYLVDKFGYQIAILTQNDGNSNTFYQFNKNIDFYDMILKGNIFQFFISYFKAINKKIKLIKPDVIVVCDNGLKAYLFPFIAFTKVPIIFESHGSRFVEDFKKNNNFRNRFFSKIKYSFKKFCASKFDKIVVLSLESLKEWNVKNAIIIPNPSFFESNKIAKLISKKVIVVARHSYEKGLDRLLPIWKKIIEKHEDWQLEIYGKSSENKDLKKQTTELNLDRNISLFEPIKNICEKYLDASMLLMTSRQEGLPMVLIEAMTLGLPCIAYDCPVGPSAIINNNKNGFLIENGNENEFVKAIEILIIDEDLRIAMGQNAKKSSERFNLDLIMIKWDSVFKEIIS